MTNKTISHNLDELCIEITGKCLMNCIHCSSPCNLSTPHEMSINKIRGILKEAKTLGTKIVEFSGGEPLLHSLISDIIREAKQDFEVRLYTCGFLGKPNHCGVPQSQLSLLSDLRLDRIIFNLQGATSKTHEKITRTKGSFNNVMNSIKEAKLRGLWSGVHFVPMKFNYKELQAVAQLCKELKVDELAVLRFVSQGRGKTNQQLLELNQKEFEELLLDIVLLKKEYGHFVQIRTGCPMNFCSLIDKTIAPVKCKVGLSTLLINFDGKIIPCPAFKQIVDFELGNINKESLQTIWQNSHILAQLRKLDFKEIEGCKNCHDLDYCQGRCVAQRFHKYGDIKVGPDPLCPYQIKKRSRKERSLAHAVP